MPKEAMAPAAKTLQKPPVKSPKRTRGTVATMEKGQPRATPAAARATAVAGRPASSAAADAVRPYIEKVLGRKAAEMSEASYIVCMR